MPLGALKLKGGETLGGVKKKKKASKKHADATAEQASKDTGDVPAATADQDGQAGPSGAKPEGTDYAAAATNSKLEYEKEFKFETKRMEEGKARGTAWGVTYRAPPAILHGYDKKVKGDTYEERLDLRCAKKADRMCK